MILKKNSKYLLTFDAIFAIITYNMRWVGIVLPFFIKNTLKMHDSAGVNYV